MCGKESELFKTEIEGTVLNVCSGCGKFGKILGRIKTIEGKKKEKVREKEPIEELLELIVPDYSERIKKKREQLGLKQEEFAKKISEKESIIHHIESGKFTPGIELAKKLERFLKIKLVEQHIESAKKEAASKAESVTIGDVIKLKRRH